MRIGIYAPVYSPLKLGVNVFTENLIARLSRRWELVVFARPTEAFTQYGVQLRVLPELTRGQPFRLLWENNRFPRQLRQERVDLVLAPFSELPVSLPIPAIAVLHDLTPLILHGSSSPEHTFFFSLALRLLRAASAIVTVSEHTKLDAVKAGILPDRPIHTIYPGTRYAPSDAALPDPRIRTPYLLYVGGLAPHKNTSLLLDGFNELRSEIPHQLVLAGTSSERQRAETDGRIVRLQLQERVLVLSKLSDEQIASLYSHCELFIFPSHYEGFGSPVLEAMACGAPVLCSNASSIPEVGGDAVMYFSPDSKTELGAGIKRLLGDAELRRQMSRKGRARAQLFTWSRTADAFSSLINQLLRREVPGSTDQTGQSRTRPFGQRSGI
jgi:glycosyltransferase involved in cell wall biosynthesis